jgi:HAE1 family hydrophobic/amphiphilic exporter-1
VDETAVIAEKISDIVLENCPENKQMYYLAGDTSISCVLTLVDKADRSRSTFEIAESLKPHFENIAGCEISCSSASTISLGSGSELNVQLTGDDFGTLEMIADDLMTQIYALGDVAELKTSLSKQMPEVKVTIKREAASQYGLTAATIGAAVRAE